MRTKRLVADEQLDSTCMVLGLFEHWQCVVAEVPLTPGGEEQNDITLVVARCKTQ